MSATRRQSAQHRADGEPDREQLHRHRRRGHQGLATSATGSMMKGRVKRTAGRRPGSANVSRAKVERPEGRWECHDRGELHRHGPDRQGRHGPRQRGASGIDAAQDLLRGPPAHRSSSQTTWSRATASRDLFASANLPVDLATYTIANNLVGTNATGTAALGNGFRALPRIRENARSCRQRDLRGLTGVWTQSHAVTELRLGRGPGQPDRHRQDGPGRPWQHRRASRSSGSGNLDRRHGAGPGKRDRQQRRRTGSVWRRGSRTRSRIIRSSATRGGHHTEHFVGQPVPAPKLTFTPGAGATGTLSGTLKASPNLAYTLEIFSNPSASRPASSRARRSSRT